MIRRILREDNKKDKETLSEKSARVSVHEEDKMFLAKGWIADLKDTLLNEPTGLGMAANQIGELKRIIATKRGGNINIFINPQIIHGFGNVKSKEGCLSRPGISTEVNRFKAVRLSWYDENGKLRIRKFTGTHAIIIQHEIDHLNGVLI